MSITTMQIGAVLTEDWGSDEYILVKNTEDAIDIEAVREEILARYYREGAGPGQYYCHHVRVIADPIHNDRCIVIVQHRYDV